MVPELHVTVASPLAYHCTGSYSHLTFTDCQGAFYNSTGCYYLEDFAEYRPCSAICNSVTPGSLDEEKCRTYCPGKWALGVEEGGPGQNLQ